MTVSGIIFLVGVALVIYATMLNISPPFREYEFRIQAFPSHENLTISQLNLTFDYNKKKGHVEFDLRGTEVKNIQALQLILPKGLRISNESVNVVNVSISSYKNRAYLNRSYYTYLFGEDYLWRPPTTIENQDSLSYDTYMIEFEKRKGTYEMGVELNFTGEIVPNGYFTIDVQRGKVQGRGESFIDFNLAHYNVKRGVLLISTLV